MPERGVVDVLHVEDDPGYALMVRKSLARSAAAAAFTPSRTAGRPCGSSAGPVGFHFGTPHAQGCGTLVSPQLLLRRSSAHRATGARRISTPVLCFCAHGGVAGLGSATSRRGHGSRVGLPQVRVSG